MDEVEQLDDRVRISLIDLFVWMSCTGLFCAVSQNSFQLIWQDNFTAILLLIPVLLAYPVGLTALFLFGMRRLRRKPTIFQPGHWLLCLQGVAGILYIASTLKSLVIDSGYFIAFPLREHKLAVLYSVDRTICRHDRDRRYGLFAAGAHDLA